MLPSTPTQWRGRWGARGRHAPPQPPPPRQPCPLEGQGQGGGPGPATTLQICSPQRPAWGLAGGIAGPRHHPGAPAGVLEFLAATAAAGEARGGCWVHGGHVGVRRWFSSPRVLHPTPPPPLPPTHHGNPPSTRLGRPAAPPDFRELIIAVVVAARSPDPHVSSPCHCERAPGMPVGPEPSGECGRRHPPATTAPMVGLS